MHGIFCDFLHKVTVEIPENLKTLRSTIDLNNFFGRTLFRIE